MMLAVEQADDVRRIATELMGWRVDSATPVAGGGNNRIFRLVGAGGVAALKFYPLQHEDPRDRLSQEYSALEFLSRNGISETPRPLARDDVRRCAAYEWIEGQAAGAASEADVDALADFFIKLQELRGRPGADRLAAASASCFSPAMMADQLRQRLARIRDVVEDGTDAGRFLRDLLMPRIKQVLEQLESECGQAEIEFAQPLPRSRQSLSPSDFGLHNALRRDGRLAFIDFEYFGWDDPAKATLDVMFHPGTALPFALAGRYRSRLEAVLAASDPSLPRRIDVLLPVIGLMWCVMLLNEFLPERWARRQLAGHSDTKTAVQARQLAKARNLFGRITQ